MANKIVLKKSSVASKVPTTTDLDYGELALNYTDGKLYYKTSTNTISSFNAGAGVNNGFTTISVSGQSDIIADSSSDILTLVAGSGISIATDANTDTVTFSNSSPNITTDISITHAASSVTVNSSDGADGTINAATTSIAGVMSSSDKTKLDGIASGAEVNQNAFSNIAVSGQTTVAADAKTDTLTLVAGTNVTITTDATNDAITISANDTSVDWSEIQNKPDPVITVTLTGDVTGTANTTLTDLASGTVSVSTTIAANSVELGTDTTGNYVASIATTAPLSGGAVGSEGGALTLSLASGYGDTQNPYASKTANYFLAAPNGTAGVPTFRAIVAADIPTLNQSTTGNAATATKLATARTISLSGDATGSVSFDGSANADIAVTIAANNVALGTDTTGNYVATIAGTANQITVAGSGSETAAVTLSLPQDIATTSNVTFNNLTLSGNLTVNGTTTTVNSTTVTLDDPIVTLGGDTAPTVDDNKDRGVEFRWHNGTVAKVGFFGFDDSTQKFTFIPDATNTSEVFSGTKGTIDANVEWADVLNKPDPVVTVTLTGDVTGTASATLTDLASGTVSVATTIAADSVALGTDTTGNYVASITNGSYITGGNGGSEGAALTIAVDATSANTASKVVARDASGNFSAGTVTVNALAIDGAVQDYATVTTTATTRTALASFAAATYGSCEIMIQATQGTLRQISKLLITHNGTTAEATEYGTIITSGRLFTVDVDISGGSVRILITPTGVTSTVFKAAYTLIGA